MRVAAEINARCCGRKRSSDYATAGMGILSPSAFRAALEVPDYNCIWMNGTASMPTANRSQKTNRAPKKRPRHHSYDTNVDEPAQLLKQEAVDIEEEVPAEDSEPIERRDREDAASPAFEE